MLWTYHTTSQTLINETSFNLVFSIEVVISIKIGLLTIRIKHYDESSYLIWLTVNLDLIEENKDKACLYMVVYR